MLPILPLGLGGVSHFGQQQITKRVPFRTFRHAFTELLTQNNENVKVVQELLRHANNRIALDLHAQAGMAEKAEAQRKVVEVELKKGKPVI